MSTVKFTVEPYGEFEAKIRDLETDLRIALRTDEQIAARGIDPNVISGSTKQWFGLLTTFAETVNEKTLPQGFDVGQLLKGKPSDGTAFLLAYSEALIREERRFRGELQEVPEGDGLGQDPAAPLQG